MQRQPAAWRRSANPAPLPSLWSAPWRQAPAALFALLAFTGCDSADLDCTRGYEGCFCTAEYRCLDDLVCLSEHCVDPEAMEDTGDPPTTSEETDEAPVDNVTSCEAFIDSWDCGPPGGVELLDCSVYDISACDVRDYFECLADNTSCTNGALDASQWTSCATLAECGT